MYIIIKKGDDVMAKEVKLVGITGNYKIDDSHVHSHGLTKGVAVVIEKYRYNARVLDSCQTDGITALPVVIPPMGEAMFPLLEKIDGLIFTGAISNIHPDRYGGHKPRDGNVADVMRDDTTLPMFEQAMQRGLPILCICRGAQELNVALGGTLHQHLEELPNYQDHRYEFLKGKSYDDGFREVHDITVKAGGVLEKIYNKIDAGKKKWRVNSAHGQGVDKLAKVLRVEALADDGVVEAFSYPDYTKQGHFLLAVQWHPEADVVIDQPQNKILFQEFGKAL
ncbi:MAG: gamma-glutamyl-gamma-aminobutyrate hydrolase family protein [Alphaproteobacteria bacterium]